MSYSTTIGLLFVIFLIGMSVSLTSSNHLIYLDPIGLLLVIGGTIGTTVASFPTKELRQMSHSIKMVFHKETVNSKRDIDELIKIGKLWYRGDMAAIETELDTVENEYLSTGVQLILDGTPVNDVIQLLKWRIMRLRQLEFGQANLFRAMASYSPAFGMIGTLIGLVNMMQDMGTKEFQQVGFNMSIALITTFYGVILANLVFKPIAVKLARRTEKRIFIMKMILEGMILISEKRTPSFIRETLHSFVIHHPDELSKASREQLLEDITDEGQDNEHP